MERTVMLCLYIDADACPVKQEAYRVAERFGLRVVLVANKAMRVPNEDWIELVIVEGSFDAADDWIEEHAEARDIVVTSDIPLASRCLKKGAWVLAPDGRPFTVNNIGSLMASRELMARLREWGDVGGGPPPFEKSDRSRFLMALDETIKRIQRGEDRAR